MIALASQEYYYANDDILSDAISSISNMDCDVGEVIGPIFAGALIGIIGYQNNGAIVGFGYFTYGLIYLFGSGLFGKWISGRKVYDRLKSSDYEKYQE